MHFWRFQAHARREYNFTSLSPPPPPLPPKNYCNFFWFSTLHWVGRGNCNAFKGKQRFCQTSLVKHRKYTHVSIPRTFVHDWRLARGINKIYNQKSNNIKATNQISILHNMTGVCLLFDNFKLLFEGLFIEIHLQINVFFKINTWLIMPQHQNHWHCICM